MKKKRPKKTSEIVVNNNVKFKEYIKVFGCLILIFLFIYIVFLNIESSEKERVASIKEKAKVTTCKVISVGNLKGTYAIVEYYINNVRFERRDGSPLGTIYEGENYEIIYDSLNPKESKINFARPIFLKEQYVGVTSGSVIYINDHKVGYVYNVNGVVYRKFQEYEISSNNFKLNETYEVIYLINNPKLSIINSKY